MEADADDDVVGTLETAKQIDFGPGDEIGATGFFLAGGAAVSTTYGIIPDRKIPPDTFENGSATYALVAYGRPPGRRRPAVAGRRPGRSPPDRR